MLRGFAQASWKGRDLLLPLDVIPCISAVLDRLAAAAATTTR